MSLPTAKAAWIAQVCAWLRFMDDDKWKKSRERMLFQFAGGSREFLGGQVVRELVEIEIVRAPFQFTALEVDIVRPHRLLGRSERLIKVAVGNQAVLVESAKIEIPKLLSLGGREGRRVTRGVNPH